MTPIREQRAPIEGGGILYDAARLDKAEPQWFSRSFWSQRGELAEVAGGRAAVCFLGRPGRRWVWRHYRRGGLIAKVCRDGYLWTGESRTRSFSEWRLLAELRRRNLPVPAPIAARYVRRGPIYRADLITEELPPSQTLAQRMSAGTDVGIWRSVGRTIARFHAEGVHHADLNANNILIDESDAVYLLDFDRGRIRPRGSWEHAVLSRLHRSLLKISDRDGHAFDPGNWAALMQGIADSG